MSSGLMAIRMRLFGAKETAAEARAVSGEIAATGDAAALAGTKAGRAAGKVGILRRGWSLLGKTAKWTTGLIGIGGVFALADAARSTEDLAKSTSRLTKMTGLNAVQASSWLEITKARGIDSTQLGMMFNTLSKQIRGARQGSASSVTAFKQLGISMDLINKASPQKVLMAVADAYERLGPSANRTAINQQLFGRSGQKVISILADGSGALRHQIGIAKQYGAVMGQDMVDRTMKTVKAQRKMELALDGIKLKLGNALMPFLAKATGWLAKFFNQLRTGHGTGGKVRDLFEDIGNTLKDLWPFVQNVLLPLGKGVMDSVVPGIQTLAKWLGAVGTAAKPLRGVFVALGWVLGLFLGGEIAKAIEWLGKFSKIFRVLSKPVAITMRILGWLGGKMGWLAKIVTTVAVGIQAQFGGIGKAASAVWRWVSNAFGNVVNFLKGIPDKARDVLKTLGGILVAPWNWAKPKIQAVISWIEDKVDTIKNAVSDLKSTVDDVTGFVNPIGGGGPNIPNPLSLVGGATGGRITAGGDLIIGEHGPEIMRVPRGAAIEPLRGRDRRAAGLPPRVDLSGVGGGGGGPLVIHSYLVVDGKTVAEATTRASESAAARQ